MKDPTNGTPVPGPTSSPGHETVSEAPPASQVSGFDLGDPAQYLNRELSWIEFNTRVLAEAEREDVPLAERLKFLGIFASNLDEFFMVRVAGLKSQRDRTADVPPDGLTAVEQLTAIAARVHALVDRAYRAWNTLIRPGLKRAGIVLVHPSELDPIEVAALDERFRNDVFPVLTPLAIDPGHPFPHLRNKNINLGIMFSREHEGEEPGFGVIQVPAMLPRLMPVRVEGAERAYVLIEDVIARHVVDFFQAHRLRGVYPFRVTRNFDLEIDEEEGEDLLQTIQAELRRRDRGNAVRLEIGVGEVVENSIVRLCKALHISREADVYRVAGPLYFADLSALVGDLERRDLRDERFVPVVAPVLRDVDDMFAVLRERDVMLHHPFDSFATVVEFLDRAADDPNVLAIKQTLYRAGGDSPIVRALARAAENGKQVTAVVELKARFDEASNIRWAHTLEQSGVQVIYGLLGLKTHAKALLVVRKERDKLRRYVHVSTGNYNLSTAKLYTDVGLLTANPEIGEDVTSLFNLLTGYSAPPKWNRLVVAPLGLHEAILGMIAREAQHARAGRPASIRAQMNALVDVDVIDALYGASEAGVEIDLRIRGVCCLRPGIPNLSSRIRVRATLDRFLEHVRLFRFENGGADEMYISSADWMPRNFHRRVEIMTPILDPKVKQRLRDILDLTFADDAKSWELGPDGLYDNVKLADPGRPMRAQQRFTEIARERFKAAEVAANSGRFHVIGPTNEEERRARRVKDGKKKRLHPG